MSIVSRSLPQSGAELTFLYDPVRLIDSYSSQPLKKAVLLVPCGHSVSHETAFKVFGLASECIGPNGLLNLSVERSGQCPICSHEIVTYVPNHTLRYLEESLRQIQDLFTLNPLKEEVLLLPCGESVSEITARYYYGTPEEMRDQPPKACLTCLRLIVTYVPNQTLRELEKLISKVNQNKHLLLRPLLAHRATKEPFPTLPFPGKKALFDCLYAWGQPVNHPDGPVCNMMTFHSFTEDSFLMKAAVYEDKKGHRFVSITCRDAHIETFRRYLVTLGALENIDCFRGTFYAHLPHERTWALHFLTGHNTFSNERALSTLVKLLISYREEEQSEQEAEEEALELTTVILNSPRPPQTPQAPQTPQVYISEKTQTASRSNAFKRFFSSISSGFTSFNISSLFPCVGNRPKAPNPCNPLNNQPSNQQGNQQEHEVPVRDHWRYNRYTRMIARQ